MNGVQNYVTNLKRSKQLSRRYTVQDRPPCANTKKKKERKRETNTYIKDKQTKNKSNFKKPTKPTLVLKKKVKQHLIVTALESMHD